MELPNFRYYYDAKILEVTDGDTVLAELDLGFRIRWVEKFRFYGINTYEINDKDSTKRDLGQKGRQYVVDKTSTAKSIIFNTHLDKMDKYGRWLVVVYYQDANSGEWKNLNDELLASGLAVPMVF